MQDPWVLRVEISTHLYSVDANPAKFSSRDALLGKTVSAAG
jgi:hypothetical protein